MEYVIIDCGIYYNRLGSVIIALGSVIADRGSVITDWGICYKRLGNLL